MGRGCVFSPRCACWYFLLFRLTSASSNMHFVDVIVVVVVVVVVMGGLVGQEIGMSALLFFAFLFL